MKTTSNDKNLKKKFHNSKGFTLMEVIIVIAILAILAAIAVPTITGYIEKAKEVSDLTTGRTIIQAAQTSIVEARAAGEIPPDTIVQVAWVTASAHSQGKVYIGEASTAGETSAILPSNYKKDAGKVFSGARDRMATKIGGEVSSYTSGDYIYIDFELADSKVVNQASLRIHINSSTGEMALAALPTDPNKNVWVDKMGLDITSVP